MRDIYHFLSNDFKQNDSIVAEGKPQSFWSGYLAIMRRSFGGVAIVDWPPVLELFSLEVGVNESSDPSFLFLRTIVFCERVCDMARNCAENQENGESKKEKVTYRFVSSLFRTASK